jgi:hypothetical protein
MAIINYPILFYFVNTKANIEDTTKNCKKEGCPKRKGKKKRKKKKGKWNMQIWYP